MKIWTYQEMKAKVLGDLDLYDETFISPNEVAGYFNEATSEAGAEIHDLNQDYFLTRFYMPLVAGTQSYALPTNIYANKIRGIVYANGSLIYEVKKLRRRGLFEAIANIQAYGSADYYNYILANHVPGQATLELYPTSRDTAILPPTTGSFTPIILWYLRNVARVPMVAYNGDLAELTNTELLAPTQINPATDTLATFAGTATIGIPQQGVPGANPSSIAYVTGDIVQVSAGPGGALPSPLVAKTDYYVIALGGGAIKLATSLANATTGTAIDITTTGTVYMLMQVRATTAIVKAHLIDIPEFATFIMQWVKCRCMGKEDPRLESELNMLVQQKKEMVDSLTSAVPDDNDEIFPDFSLYQDMS